MNVVGRVGSLISQGVYSVATPFHPFGGAVDIIVVQQEDGTFRSTPWYVRFGKFQGVLKGAEKVVGIHVNGVEANFHMYLENTGEAFFVREVDPNNVIDTGSPLNVPDSVRHTEGDDDIDDENEASIQKTTISNGKLEDNVSDSEGVQSLDEHASIGAASQGERAESDSSRRYYELQDEQSSLESEYGSTRFENLEDVENLAEPQLLDSEVILVSIDGHILTAPISSPGEEAEVVQLCTPQFHLGPGKQVDLCEDSSRGDAWGANYDSDTEKDASSVSSRKACRYKSDVNDSSVKLELSQRKECAESVYLGETNEKNKECVGSVYLGKTNEKCSVLEGVVDTDNNTGNAPCSIRRDDAFGSCFELTELAKQSDHTNVFGVVSEADTHNHQDAGRSEGSDTAITDNHGFSQSLPTFFDFREDEGSYLQNKAGISIKAIQEVASRSICNDFIGDIPVKTEELEGQTLEQISPKHDSQLGRCSVDSMTQQESTSSMGVQTDLYTRFEISLCRNKLHAGMGSEAADDVFDSHCISEEEFKSSAASIIKNDNLVVRYRHRYLPWDKAAGIVLGIAAFGIDLPIESEDVIAVEQEMQMLNDDTDEALATPSGRRWRLWPIPFRRVKTLGHSNSDASNEELFVDSEPALQRSLSVKSMLQENDNVSPNKHLMKTHNPTTEQISSLNLVEGQNTITFSFSSRVLGKQQVDAHIYLWKWNTRIVISDVDGTITKSDVLGQFMPLVGRDWTQSGVAMLFSAIKENGYQLLFLSARAIVQAYLTRNFLLNLKQDGKALPNGPVVISPDGLFPSLYREVIRRAPHEFKIACLEDIRALFPADYNPFYAGFGNRDTDELSYRKIGIPEGKIFIINPKGEVAINHRVDVRSYTSLHTLVNDMFPPTSMAEQEDFNSWNFWKMPLLGMDM